MHRYAIATTDDSDNLLIVRELHLTPDEDGASYMLVSKAYAADVWAGRAQVVTFEDRRLSTTIARAIGAHEGRHFFTINMRAITPVDES